MDIITLENVCTRGDALVLAVIVRNHAGEVAVPVALTAFQCASGRAAGSKGAIQVGRAAPSFLVACLMIIMIVISTSILFFIFIIFYLFL